MDLQGNIAPGPVGRRARTRLRLSWVPCSPRFAPRRDSASSRVTSLIDSNHVVDPGAFRAWALGDMKTNNARGLLAEWLVAQAVDAETGHRVEWDNFDVITADGVRIEVKATGYVQAWDAHVPVPASRPRRSFLRCFARSRYVGLDGAGRTRPRRARSLLSARPVRL